VAPVQKPVCIQRNRPCRRMLFPEPAAQRISLWNIYGSKPRFFETSFLRIGPES
jgi:hypothetical protein